MQSPETIYSLNKQVLVTERICYGKSYRKILVKEKQKFPSIHSCCFTFCGNLPLRYLILRMPMLWNEYFLNSGVWLQKGKWGHSSFYKQCTGNAYSKLHKTHSTVQCILYRLCTRFWDRFLNDRCISCSSLRMNYIYCWFLITCMGIMRRQRLNRK